MSPASLSSYADTLRRADPEDFGHLPLYLVDRADVPDLAWPDDAAAYTAVATDLELQPHLEAIGQWCGRGLAMVVDIDGVREDHLAGLIIHEAGHWLTGPLPSGLVAVRSLCTTAGWQADTESLADFLATVPQLPATTAWADHGSDFIRAALHLWSRWQPAFPLDVLPVAGGQYDLSPLWLYYFKCDTELAQHRSGSIRDILATPEPAGFAALSRLDTEG
jgi:hypothetical protein